jgi:hypothetical protein
MKRINPSYHWGTSEGSRDFDRLLDSQTSFQDKLLWLEEAETLSLRFPINRKRAIAEGRLPPEEGSSPYTPS